MSSKNKKKNKNVLKSFDHQICFEKKKQNVQVPKVPGTSTDYIIVSINISYVLT